MTAKLGSRASDLVLGTMAGVTLSLMTVALSALMFTGPLSEFLPLYLTLMLSGCAIAVFLTAAFSRVPTLLSMVQTAPAALGGALTAAIGASAIFADDRSGLLSTTLMAIGISTIGVAVAATLFWRYRLTRLAQFLPYPVSCGFLAGVGWLVLDASVRVVTGHSLTLGTLDELFLGDALWRLVLLLGAGLGIFFLSRRFPSPMTVPAAVVVIVAAFYGVAMIVGWSVAELHERAWLFGPFAAGGVEPALQHLSLDAVNWQLIGQNLGGIVAIILVSIISMLVFLTGIEVALQREIDFNHELKIISLSCLANTCLGAVAAYPTPSLSILFNRLGAATRLLGFSAGAVVLLVAIVGPSVLNYLPKIAFAALLFFVALGLLRDWLWATYARLSRPEYVILVIIFLIVVVAGFLAAVALGILVCAVYFVLKYSTLNLIKTEGDGMSIRSDVDRSLVELEVLDKEGGRLIFFRLEGYLFFGTASLLFNRVRAKLEALHDRPAYIVLDLHYVSDMDSSAVFAFVKLHQLAEREDGVLILTEPGQTLLERFRSGGVLPGEDSAHMRVFGETDLGLEWAEEQLIAQAGIGKPERPIDESLIGLMDGDQRAAELGRHLQRVTLQRGQYLYRLGEPGRDLYFIESGAISLMVPLDGGGELRLRKLGPGTVVGELDFYDGTPRDADALVTEPGVLWQLSADKLEQLNHTAPNEAAMFHAMMARAMSRRIGQLSDELRAAVG